MIKPLFTIAGEGISIDQSTNQISIFNIFEGFNAASYPFFLHRICFLTLWERDTTDPDSLDASVAISAGDQVLLTHIVNLNFNAQLKTRNVIQLDGLAITTPGLLKFSMVVENHSSAEYTMTLENLPQNNLAQSATGN